MSEQPEESPAETLALNVQLEYMPPEAVALLADEALSPHQLLSGISAQIAGIAPSARICFSGDFVQSVQDRFDARDLSVEYGAVRGANFAVAKTMRSASGGVDIVVNAEMLFLPADIDQDEAHNHVILLLHLAAHEAVHALHHSRGEDSEATFNSMMITSPSDAYYATEAGTVIEEYRAELVAEQMHANPASTILSFQDDLASLAGSIDDARALSTTDVSRAARLHLAAATNYWKALSLVAARLRAAGTDIPRPILTSAGWQKYAAPLWERWQAALGELPIGLAAADAELLREVTREMMPILEQFFVMTGVARSWDADGGGYMYWR
ncbi:hypothetical protein [Agromyces sp. Soil535]|uniref:hypothetical protein n=1 Tax=Agromyces sp. Soil535 TaxID=1736390 RepID=UPI0006F68755|nr:hypothetical protein [Agromyces sp. Soil535]KRE30440.1 hypothetical protein ASG80_16935 [Agromyces sp. Soil535]